ncbi:hypothetical protein ACICHK_19180 [Streptomyces sp. AHU1]|uniref:hypothetical protein n=1 Tax=Streptomyces sp. AHU1 TaxID=3377215 RepID=UPI00387802AA
MRTPLPRRPSPTRGTPHRAIEAVVGVAALALAGLGTAGSAQAHGTPAEITSHVGWIRARATPTKAGVAVYDSYGITAGRYALGGTSASAPIIAGAYALDSTPEGVTALADRPPQCVRVPGDVGFPGTRPADGPRRPAAARSASRSGASTPRGPGDPGNTGATHRQNPFVGTASVRIRPARET